MGRPGFAARAQAWIPAPSWWPGANWFPPEPASGLANEARPARGRAGRLSGGDPHRYLRPQLGLPWALPPLDLIWGASIPPRACPGENPAAAGGLAGWLHVPLRLKPCAQMTRINMMQIGRLSPAPQARGLISTQPSTPLARPRRNNNNNANQDHWRVCSLLSRAPRPRLTPGKTRGEGQGAAGREPREGTDRPEVTPLVRGRRGQKPEGSLYCPGGPFSEPCLGGLGWALP